MKKECLLLCALLLLPSAAKAQNVSNPSGVQFTASPDHATIDSYELDILRADLSVLQTLNLGKPVPDATQTCSAPLNVQPVAFGTGYSVAVRAKVGAVVSASALSTNKFDRVPGGPSKVLIKAPEPEPQF